MTHNLNIDPSDGSIRIDGCSLILRSGLSSTQVKSALSQFYERSMDHRNGYAWNMFRGFKFAGYPCGIAICFHFDRLVEVHFGVSLPGSGLEGGWPTREAIDDEVRFIRSVLSDVFGVSFETGSQRFKWGEVWSMFDQRGFIASSGIRYAV